MSSNDLLPKMERAGDARQSAAPAGSRSQQDYTSPGNTAFPAGIDLAALDSSQFEMRAVGEILIALELPGGNRQDEARGMLGRLEREWFHSMPWVFDALSAAIDSATGLTRISLADELVRAANWQLQDATRWVESVTDANHADVGGAGLAFESAILQLRDRHERRERFAEAQQITARVLDPAPLIPSQVDAGLSRHFDAGPFPVDAFAPVMRDAILTVVEAYGLPLEMAGMAALAVLAATCGKGWMLERAVSGRKNFANIFVLIGADRGAGKGSLGCLVAPLIEANAKMEAEWRDNTFPQLAAREQVLAKKLERAAREASRSGMTLEGRECENQAVEISKELASVRRAKESGPSLWSGDCTSQKLAMLLAANADEALLIYSPEAGSVIRNWAGKYDSLGKADIDVLLSGYSCESVKVDRVGRPSVTLSEPCLSALLLAQPYLIRELLGNEEMRQRGLLARSLSILVPEREWSDDDGTQPEPDARVLGAWGALIGDIYRQRCGRSEAAVVYASDGATQTFLDYHNRIGRLANGPLKPIREELMRARENACRIALALHVVKSPRSNVLKLETANAAVQIGEWALWSSIKVLDAGLIEADRKRVQKLVDLIRAVGGRETLGRLAKRRGQPESQIRELVRRFPAILRLEPHAANGGGPRTERVVLVPAATHD